MAVKQYEVTVKFYVDASDEGKAGDIGKEIGDYIYRAGGVDSAVVGVVELD